MLIAKVIGTTVATIKDEKLTGRKLLVVRQTDERGNPVGKPFVAIDSVDAGVGDLVLTAAGSSARQTNVTKDTPVDAVIMAVIDSPGSRRGSGLPQVLRRQAREWLSIRILYPSRRHATSQRGLRSLEDLVTRLAGGGGPGLQRHGRGRLQRL